MTTTQKSASVATRFYIRAEYFYYSGTCYAPQDGALRDEADYDQRRLEFASRAEAVAHLCNTDGRYPSMGCTRNDDGSYSVRGTYCTSHGEYARPIYRIRKVPVRRVN